MVQDNDRIVYKYSLQEKRDKKEEEAGSPKLTYAKS